MEQVPEFELFDLKRLLIGGEIPYSFLLEVLLRSAVMFLMVLIILRISGKRGIKQLSVFELAIFISLGSAVGDPMFYQEVGLLPATVVLVVVISLYKGITFLTGRFEKIEEYVEGKPVKLVEDGKIIYEAFRKEALGYDELFAQLRQHSVSHLGQVRGAYLETSGELSIFYFPDDQVIPGLPILPGVYDYPAKGFYQDKDYACTHCGQTQNPAKEDTCAVCEENEWLETDQAVRVH